MSIAKNRLKINRGRVVLLITFFFSLYIAFFLVGYVWGAKKYYRYPISVSYDAILADSLGEYEELRSKDTNRKEIVVGSKSGTVYYLPWCKSGQNIKLENLIVFDSIADAERRGYKKSKQCRGL